MDEMKGRFAQILSLKVPDEQTRLLANTMLHVKGITPVKIRADSQRPRFKM